MHRKIINGKTIIISITFILLITMNVFAVSKNPVLNTASPKYTIVSGGMWMYDNVRDRWAYDTLDGKVGMDRVLKGWNNINDNGEVHTYYFDEEGIMKTGWYIENQKIYYFQENGNNKGAMAIGNIDADGTRYYFNEYGELTNISSIMANHIKQQYEVVKKQLETQYYTNVQQLELEHILKKKQLEKDFVALQQQIEMREIMAIEQMSKQQIQNIYNTLKAKENAKNDNINNKTKINNINNAINNNTKVTNKNEIVNTPSQIIKQKEQQQTNNKDLNNEKKTNAESPLGTIVGRWEYSPDQSVIKYRILELNQQKENEMFATSGWYKIEDKEGHSSWHIFDENGILKTGWFTDQAGNTYYLNEKTDTSPGAMNIGWKEINGKKYYFTEQADGKNAYGSLVKNQKVDGKQIDENGELVEEQTK